jgi:RNA polymerase sigma-70 factor (ECF subfamily)
MADTFFNEELLRCQPRLTVLATKLTHSTEWAEELVAETTCRALENHKQFARGTNMMAWLYTILRNDYYTVARRRAYEVEDVDGVHTLRLSSQPSQMASLDLQELRRAMSKLSSQHREALLQVAAGEKYEAAAVHLGIAVGTLRSRVNRARMRLVILLSP